MSMTGRLLERSSVLHPLGMPRRRGTATLALGLTVLAILVGLGITGAFHVSGLRRNLEWVHSRQLAECAASSAFEEVCQRCSEHFGPVPLAKLGEPPLPDRMPLEWPAKMDPEIVRAGLKDEGIEVSPVSILSVTPWELVKDGQLVEALLKILGMKLSPLLGVHLIQEAGIVELTVEVKVHLGSTRLGRRVTVRRYVTVQAEEGGDRLPSKGRVTIMAGNLVREVTEL